MITKSDTHQTEVVNVGKDSFSHYKIYTDIVIDASPEQVWSVLTDTASYKDWAAFMIAITGDITDGENIAITFQFSPQKDRPQTIAHTITVASNNAFYWSERGPMGIHDNHHFIVEALGDGKTRFIQSDELTRGVTWLLGGMLARMYAREYRRFNRSLKKEVERRFAQSNV